MKHTVCENNIAFSDKALSRIVHDMRNHLDAEQQELVQNEVRLVVRELKLWLSAQELNSIKLCPKQSLSFTHKELMTVIQTEYELWIDGHHITDMWRHAEGQIALSKIDQAPSSFSFSLCNGKRVTVSGIGKLPFDDHPCQPSNFSLTCLRRLWQEL